MQFEYVLKRDGKEISRENGNEDLKTILKKLDEIVVRQKE